MLYYEQQSIFLIQKDEILMEYGYYEITFFLLKQKHSWQNKVAKTSVIFVLLGFFVTENSSQIWNRNSMYRQLELTRLRGLKKTYTNHHDKATSRLTSWVALLF